MKKLILILFAFSFIISCSKPIEKRKMTKRGYDFIKKSEGCRLHAYNDGAAWTIGYGNTFYPDGQKVKQGDRITQATAEKLFKIVVDDFANKTNRLIFSEINTSNLEALTSYTYNRGIGAFKKTELIVMVNNEPKDFDIKGQFVIEWGTNKRYKYSLIKRRMKEAELYFSEV